VPFKKKHMKDAFRTEWTTFAPWLAPSAATPAAGPTQRRKRSVFCNALDYTVMGDGDSEQTS